MIVIGEHDSETGDAAPLHIRMKSDGFLADIVCCFADDFGESLGGTKEDAVRRTAPSSQRDYRAQFIARVEDVGNALVVTARLTGTASRRM